MKIECRDEFINQLDWLDTALCLGYGFRVSDIKKGMKFLISPNFQYNMSTDDWTLRDSLSNGDWERSGVKYHYSDTFMILDINKRRTKKKGIAYLRVKNLRNNVDFDLLKDDDELDDLSTIDLYLIS